MTPDFRLHTVIHRFSKCIRLPFNHSTFLLRSRILHSSTKTMALIGRDEIRPTVLVDHSTLRINCSIASHLPFFIHWFQFHIIVLANISSMCGIGLNIIYMGTIRYSVLGTIRYYYLRLIPTWTIGTWTSSPTS